MKHITIIFAMLIALATSLATAQTAPLKEWDTRFGTPGVDQFYSLEQTADGGYILGGKSGSGISGDKTQEGRGDDDYWIVKTNGNGIKQWDARFGGDRSETLFSLQQTSDGGYILGGISNSGISGDKTQANRDISNFSSDYWIVKTDANGIKQWDARFGGSNYDYLLSLQQTADGGYILGGWSASGIGVDKTQASQGSNDYWIVKTDANGVKQWDARFGGGSDDRLNSLQQTTDGGYILGGYSSSGIGGDKTQASQGSNDYWIIKTDANGVKQWDARFGGDSDDRLNSLQQTTDGGYILGGQSYSGISGDKTQASQGLDDYWIVKTDASGVKQWDVRFGGSNTDLMISLQQTIEGGYILGGYSLSGSGGDKTQAGRGDEDYWIVKTNANGVKQWDARFGATYIEHLRSLQQTADGGYILGGSSASGISGDKTQANWDSLYYSDDYWIVKVASDCNGGITVFTDADGDNYGDIAYSLFVEDCVIPGGYVANNTDCDDANASINPGETEIVNGIDDNCNGIIDDVGLAGDTWIQKADFGGISREYAVGFSIGSKGYIGTGGRWDYNGYDYILYKDFWEYDPVTNAWTQKADFGGTARYGAVGFSVGNKGYLGTGVTEGSVFGGGVNNKDFWEYNPDANSWIQKSDFGGTARWRATGFVLNSKGYIGTGADGYGFKRDLWEYDPVTDTWTQKADFGGAGRYDATGFSIGNKGYIGTGMEYILEGFLFEDFWEYDPLTDVWVQKAAFAGGGRKAAVGFSIGNKGYLGTGSNWDIWPFCPPLKDFWEYDPQTDTWVQKADIGEKARIFAVGFAIDGKGYVGTGSNSEDYEGDWIYKDFWEYNPEAEPSCIVPPGENTTNITGTSAKLKWNDVGEALRYKLRYQAAGATEWTKVTDVKSNKKVITGLTPNTLYYWEVKSVCSVNPIVSSGWSSKQTFTTGSLRMGDESLQQVSFQIYPNPSVDHATIQFTLPQSSHVYIKVYDMNGKEIETLLDDDVLQGDHSLSLNTNHFSKGIYIVQMVSDTRMENQKLIVQ